MAGKEGFGYQGQAEGEKSARVYSLTDNEWCWLLEVMWSVATQGGCPSMYQSTDGNALCVSIKHEKTARRYWIGPDDEPSAVLKRLCTEWNIRLASTPLSKVIEKTVEQEKAAILADKKE